jgi:cytochrome c553
MKAILFLPLVFLLFLVLLASGCSRPVIDQMAVPKSSALIDKGSKLVNGVAACGFCHGIKAAPFVHLAGGRESTDTYGLVKASNITPSKSGIGTLSDNKIIDAIRGIWPKDSDRRSPDVHRGLEWISSSDVVAIVAYLRSVTPVKNEVPVRLVGFTARNTTGLFSKAPLVQGLVPDIPKENAAQYGKYIVKHLSRCDQCHSLDSNEPSKNKLAPSLVGVASSANRWSHQDLVNFILKGGLKPSGAIVNPAECPTSFYANASEEEAKAIASYIRTL